MYVYENSGRMFGRGILAGDSLRDFDGVHLEYRKISPVCQAKCNFPVCQAKCNFFRFCFELHTQDTAGIPSQGSKVTKF
jgi:hypothetical protein